MSRQSRKSITKKKKTLTKKNLNCKRTKDKSARYNVNNNCIGVKEIRSVTKTVKIPESSGEINLNSVPFDDPRQESVTKSGTSIIKKCSRRKCTRTSKSEKNLDTRHYEHLFIRLVRYDYIPVTPKYVIDKFDALVAENQPKKQNMTCIPLPETSRPINDSEPNGLHLKALINRNRMLISKRESKKLEEMLRKQLQVKQKKTKEAVNMQKETLNSDNFETYEKIINEEQNIFKCLLCNKALCDNYQQMCLHYRLNHKDIAIQEIYFCDVGDCKFKTIYKDMLIWHIRNHLLASNLLEEEEYYCCECDELFDQREDLDIHAKENHRNEKKEYPCNTCKFVTNSQYQLQSHIFKCHVPDDMKPSYSCNICGYQLSSRRFLKRHLVIVHLQK